MNTLTPATLIKDRTCKEYRYLAIKYEGYKWFSLSGDDIIQQETMSIIGEQNGFEVTDLDLSDARKAFIKRSVPKEGSLEALLLKEIWPIDDLRAEWAAKQAVWIEVKSITDYSLLVSFLTYYERDILKNNDASSDELMLLCEKHGLPLFQFGNEQAFYKGGYWNDRFYNTGLGDQLNYGFQVERFHDVLKSIYLLYLSWRYLYLQDNGVIEMVKEIEPFSDSNCVLEESDFYRIIEDNAEDAFSFSSVSFDANNNPQLIETCGPLLHALRRQMMDIILAAHSWVDGYSVAICNCGAAFLRRNARAILCENCRTNASRVRAHRARKKEASTNAKKSEK